MKGFYLEKNAPRWIIFSIDLIIVVFSLLLAYLLRFNFSIPEVEYVDFPVIFTAVIIVKIIAFYFFKPYAGVIRHSSVNDFMRIFLSVAVSSLVFALINVIRYIINDAFLIPYSIIIIDALLTMFMMGALRITVKLIYQEIQRSSKSTTRVVIYGAGQSGLTTKRALDRLIDSKYDVAAFFDDDRRKVGKRLEGTLIQHGSELESFLMNERIDQLVIAIQSIGPERKSEIVEVALNYKVKVLSVPPVADWINGEISIKQIKKVRIEDLLGRKQIQLDLENIGNQLSEKVILVTGAAGSIGSGLVRQIAKFNPEKIIMLDQAESPMYEIDLEIKEKFGPSIAEVLVADIRDHARLKMIFDSYRPEVVFHAAAYKHVPLMEEHPAEAIRTNVAGTKCLVDLADEFKVKKFVMVSTDKAVNPTNVMGASKRIAEIYAQCKNEVSQTKYITTRFGNVLGSNGSVIPLFRKQIEKGGPITVTHPEITRFFMTIPEACQLVLEAGTMGKGGEIFIFDMGKSVKIIDLAKKMIKLSGLEEGRDIQIKFSGLRPGEKLYEELLASEENTMKTHHPQIMIATVRSYELEQVNTAIQELIALHELQEPMAIVKKMKAIVPEYLSKNSVYAQLDQEKA